MRHLYNFTRTIFLYRSVTFFFVQYVFVRCLSMRHTCCWLVKHLNKHMQLAMHAAHLHVFIKFHQSFWKECLARNNPLLNESKSIWKKERESGHRNGIAKFLTVHTGYIDKNKKKIHFQKFYTSHNAIHGKLQ